MAEEITNNVEATSQVVADATNDTNTVAETETQVESGTQESDVTQSNEGANSVENSNEATTQVTEPTVEQLQAKLKEYEVREEEDRQLREKLGIQDVDSQVYNYMNIEQQVVNQGKQEYLRLCTEYGIDADPNRIDESIKKLEETDPRKAYEFKGKFEALGNEVYGRRQAIQQQTAYYEVNKFQNEYNQLLNASPALTNIFNQYVQTYGRNTSNMYGQLKGVMDIVLPAYQEAFNAGKQYALQDKARKDTSAVQGGIATANTQTYTPANGVFTREQISKMSPDEFAKNELAIRQQMMEGKIL